MLFLILKRVILNPFLILFILTVSVYWQFFLLGKIPIPTDTLVGAYYPWLDYKWGYDAGVPIKNAPISDIFSQIYLWKNLSVKLMIQGIWPLWNPYSLSGTPLLANYQSSPFMPFNILLLIPHNIGWALFIYSQTLISSFGMFLLLRKLSLQTISSLIGAIIFSFSGLMTTYTEFGIAVWAASMLPWIFFSLICYLNKGRARYLFLMAFSFATLFLSGHAQLSLYSSVIFLAYIFYGLPTKTIIKQKTILPILFWIMAIGLASLQLIPAFDIVNSSIRSSEAYLKTENYGLAPVYEVVRLIAADFFGNPATVNHWDNVSYHEQSSFLGTLTLPLILPLFFMLFKDRKKLFWGALFIFSLIMAYQNPLSNFIYSLELPLLTYSAASRVFFLTTFSGAVLAGFASDRFLTDSVYRIWVKRFNWGFLLLLLIVFLAFIVAKSKMNLSAKEIEYLSISIKNLLVPIGILLTTSLAFLLKRYQKLMIYLIFVLLCLDLGRYFLKYNPFVPQNLMYPSTPVINFLQNQGGNFRIARADPEVMPPNTWMAYNLQSAEGYDPISLESYARYFNRVNGNPYNFGLSRFIELSKYPSTFLDALNVKYLLAVKRDENGSVRGNTFNQKLKNTDYKVVFEDKNTAVLENVNVMPRAYFVKKVTVAINFLDYITMINDPGFNPTETAVVLTNDSFPLISNAGEISVRSLPHQIELTTNNETPGFIIVSDAYEKGWNVLINGRNSPLYEVNGALKGIFVPEGKNNIQLYYWPTSFDMALKIFSISLLAVIVLCGFSIRRKSF